MQILRMAWRNVWRNSRRTAITIAAMALALAVELIYAGLVNGMVSDMAADVTELEIGDLQIFSKQYLEKPSIYETVPAHTEVLQRLDDVGYAASARLYGGGLGAAGESSSGVSFVGLDPARDAKVSTVHQAVARGAWLDTTDPKGVVVGRGLARTLALDVGSELLVLSQGADGSVANELYKVRGVLMTVAAGTDRGGIFMTESAFRDLLALPEGAHKILVRLPKDTDLLAAKAVIEPLAPGAEVMTWMEISPLLAQMLQGVQAQIMIVYFIIYVAVAILILNAMLMALFERVREFGVLKAIGYSPLQVFSMMMLEGLIQATVALGAGAAVAAPAMWYLAVYGIDVGALGGVTMVGMTMPAIWRAEFTPAVVSVPVIMLFFIVIAAVLIPATRAAMLSPVKAMSHQ